MLANLSWGFSLDQLMSQAIPEDKLTAIKEALFAERKIEAIKLYRECTGVGLAEAKSAVETLEAELHKSSPEKFLPAKTGKGCMGLVMACLFVTAAFVWLVLKCT
jgi:hypothetical protein